MHEVCHAEYNAILNKGTADIGGGHENIVLYSTLHPCKNCAQFIIHSGIGQVRYMEYRDGETYELARKLLEDAGVNSR